MDNRLFTRAHAITRNKQEFWKLRKRQDILDGIRTMAFVQGVHNMCMTQINLEITHDILRIYCQPWVSWVWSKSVHRGIQVNWTAANNTVRTVHRFLVFSWVDCHITFKYICTKTFLTQQVNRRVTLAWVSNPARIRPSWNKADDNEDTMRVTKL